MENNHEMQYVTLDDGIKYIVLKKINGNNNYIYLANSNNIKDFLIQKIIIQNGEEYLVNLDTEEEFQEAINLYDAKKNEI